MDLEHIGKQMLEALAVRGQVASLETSLANIQGQIVKADTEIQRGKKEEVSNTLDREQVQKELVWVQVAVSKAEEAVKAAGENLRLAKGAIAPAEEKVLKCRDISEQLELSILQIEEDKKTVEASRDEVSKELDAARKDLETRQAELHENGVDLNIGPVRQPKTIVM